MRSQKGGYSAHLYCGFNVKMCRNKIHIKATYAVICTYFMCTYLSGIYILAEFRAESSTRIHEHANIFLKQQ